MVIKITNNYLPITFIKIVLFGGLISLVRYYKVKQYELKLIFISKNNQFKNKNQLTVDIHASIRLAGNIFLENSLQVLFFIFLNK